MFELALAALDGLLTLIIIFGGNKLLYWITGVRISITWVRKPEKIKRGD